MQLLPAALGLMLLLNNLVPGGSLSLESLLTNMRCKCIKSTAQVINLGLVLTIDVTPPGLHCRRKEIIVTLKKNKRVCVTPEAPWIQLLIHKLTQRNATRRVPAARPRREAQQRRPPQGPPAPPLPPFRSKPAPAAGSSWDGGDTSPLP